MRCPQCQSLSTKRYGKTATAPTGLRGAGKALQRFWCHQCENTFTTSRVGDGKRSKFTAGVIGEAVTSYVEGNGSYRNLARMLSRRLDKELSRTTINGWVAAAGATAKIPLEVSRELAPPLWGGWLGVDGKHLKIANGDPAVLMIAVDQASADVVASNVVATESGDAFAELVTDAVAARYPLRGIVADLGPGAPHHSFPEACRRYFGNLPFQGCRVHFARRLDMELSTPHKRPGASLNTELKTHIRAILYANSYQEAINAYWELTTTETRYNTPTARRMIRSLRRTFEIHLTHHRHPGLPADANITENVIRQLNRKLRPMEHFATIESAEHFTRLLIAAYRWKPFTDSTTNRNGHSPLQLAGATLPTTHWLTYHQQQHST